MCLASCVVLPNRCCNLLFFLLGAMCLAISENPPHALQSGGRRGGGFGFGGGDGGRRRRRGGVGFGVGGGGGGCGQSFISKHFMISRSPPVLLMLIIFDVF